MTSPSSQTKRFRDPVTPSITGEVTKFVASSLVVVAIFVAASVPVLRHLGRTEALRDARASARLAAAGVVEPNLQNSILDGDAEALARLDRVVQERLLSDSMVRVKIWAPDGRIVYSDEPALIGARYPLGEDERQALRTGAVKAGLSDLGRPENRFEREEGELLEVYVRIRTPDGTPVLFELYERLESVVATGRRIWLTFLPALLGGLILLWLVQVPLAYRLARGLRDRHQEREVLLRKALDASNDERRRIAGDLHDGVVQDLAGVSYLLAAEADGADSHLRRTLREAAAVTRSNVQRLRSLLLEIHPPNLRVAGLEAALKDLTAPLDRRGIDADLDVDTSLELDQGIEEIVYRAAREALRNVAEHAEATRVTVRVDRSNGHVRLVVRDNGAGFDEAEREQRLEEGHVGLTLLEELAVHEDATLEITSKPGEGTSLLLEVPVR